jgi:hypothetical protein
VAHLTPADFDRLERAIADGRRISLVRQGRELVVVPNRLVVRGGREMLEARHPITGDDITVRLDDLDGFEIVSR